MNYVVTGACGFIGINLCKKLLKGHHHVVGIDNFSVGKPKELMKECGTYERFQLLRVDFSIDKVLQTIGDVFEKADVIYHLGGMSGVRESIESPRVWFENNVLGTFNILEIARKYNVKKVVIASSSACIGDVDPPIHEEMILNPISPYGASKGTKELYSSAYHHAYGMAPVCLRFSNVYGPHSTIKVSLIANFLRKILFGEELNIYGDGNQTRDFVYVDDLINAIILAGEKDVGGEIFQISTGVEISVNEITKIICNKMKELGYEPSKINYTDPAIGDIMTNYADNSKAKTMLDWSPKVDVKEGLSKTIDWFIREVK